jgi:hypothetical protein
VIQRPIIFKGKIFPHKEENVKSQRKELGIISTGLENHVSLSFQCFFVPLFL